LWIVVSVRVKVNSCNVEHAMHNQNYGTTVKVAIATSATRTAAAT
jgi:hypothetical protein